MFWGNIRAIREIKLSRKPILDKINKEKKRERERFKEDKRECIISIVGPLSAKPKMIYVCTTSQVKVFISNEMTV